MESFDHIDDFLDLVDQLDDCFFGNRDFDGDPVHSWDAAFRCCQGIDIDPPTGKNDGNPIEDSNKIFGDYEDGVAFHR
jgi:hypothetical protein